MPRGAAEGEEAVNQSVSLARMSAGGENTAELAWVFRGIWRGLSKKGDTPYPCSPGDKSAYTQSESLALRNSRRFSLLLSSDSPKDPGNL